MTYIRASRARDILVVGAGMRERDVQEVRAASGHSPEAALADALEASMYSWTACGRYGKPFAMFGVAFLAPGLGAPWLLATDDFVHNVRFVLAHTPAYIAKMHEPFPVLMNYVDARHADSRRYLRWAGFKFTGYVPEYGHEGRPFLQFTRVAPCVTQPRP